MEAKVVFFMLLLSLFSSCNYKSTERVQSSTIPIQERWHVGLRDTVLFEVFNKTYIKYHFYGDSIYRIEWGNNMLKNLSYNTIEVLGNGILGVIDKNEKAIILGQSCGTNCLCYVILPLLADKKEKKYYCVLTYDVRTNIIVFVPEGGNYMQLENIFTGQTMNVFPSFSCPATFIGDCIDTIFLKNGNLITDWKDDQCLNENVKLKRTSVAVCLK